MHCQALCIIRYLEVANRQTIIDLTENLQKVTFLLHLDSDPSWRSLKISKSLEFKLGTGEKQHELKNDD